MTDECPFLPNCGFFKKYQATKDLVCQGFILQYCRGAKRSLCKRMQYKQEHGVPPSDDMMPSGQMIMAPAGA